MKNNKRKNIPSQELVSYGDFLLPPVVPGPEVNELCKQIDEFYKNYPRQHRKQKFSDLIKGAFYAARPECRSNPDWISQASNSLREVLYPLISDRVAQTNLIRLAYKYAINKDYKSRIKNREFIQTFSSLDRLYKKVSDLTHHGTELKGFSEREYTNFSENDFVDLLSEFVSVLRKVLSLQQLYTHTIIDIIAQRKRRTKAIKRELEFVLNVNADARQYFYIKANEKWLTWLWENGFLDVIKQKAKDPTRYSYRTPELNYLVRMAEKAPAKVADIMLEVPISKETFNPEVIDRFVHICSILPADQLARIVPKIRKERWIPLMGVFNQWGFEYEKMFQKLAGARDYESIITLAEDVLSVKTKDEIEKEQRNRFLDSSFYFNDLSYTEVFEQLVSVDEKHAEKALAVAVKVMSQVVNALSRERESADEKVFQIDDRLLLLDEDLFSLELGQKDHFSRRGSIRELAAVILTLARRLIKDKCEKDDEEARRIFEQYIGSFDSKNPPLPDSCAMWRLRLVALSLCPAAFKEELKKSFFRLFSVKRYYNEIISGTEYLKALRAGFSVLSDSDKRDYVKRVIEYFAKKDKEKENEEEDWHIRYGSMVLSMIEDQLTEEEKKEAKEKGFVIDPNYQPEPSVKMSGVGTIIPQAPVSYEDFQKTEVSVIAGNLRAEWSPKTLFEKYREKSDFHRPINAEGIGEYIKKNVAERLQEYIDNADQFFDREKLDPHYTYSYLRGIQDAIKNNRELAAKTNWGGIIELFKSIKESGDEELFEKRTKEAKFSDVWLAGWDSVHSAMADILQELLAERNGAVVIDFRKYRNDIFSILGYLLAYHDPTPKDEQDKTAKITTLSGSEDSYKEKVSDPFTIAINSVRGRAYQVLVLFVYQDGKRFKKEDKVKIAEEVKTLYEDVLKRENTRAIMFLFGHYLPTFYYRGPSWIKGLLPTIFSEEESKKYLYTAAWEGYLVNNLYKEMFFDSILQKLYERGVELGENDYPPYQKHFKEPADALAIHLALAFIHFSEFNSDHPLFKKFWSVPNIKAHKTFISFIGRHVISRESATEWVKQNKINIEKLKRFWDWALKHCDPEELIGFGFWIKAERSPLDVKWLAEHTRETLEKTKGYIEWEYGLMQSLPAFVKEAPEDTLAILRAHLLEEVAKHEPVRTWLRIDDEIYSVFKELYTNREIKEEVRKLINDLLPHRNGLFWRLKSVLDESEEEK